MKPGRGKSKGNRFEHLVARELSRWLNPGDSTQLIPSRLSGGWQADSSWRQAGDLAPNGAKGEEFRRHFLVEAKHQNKDLLWSLYTQSPSQNIQGWWKKLELDAEELALCPMLVFRQNTRPILVALPKGTAWWIHAVVGGTILEYHTLIEKQAALGCGIITLAAFVEVDPLELYNTLP